MTKLEPLHSSWPSVKETLHQCAEERSRIISDELKVSLSEGKVLLNKIFNGGTPPDDLKSNAFIWKLQQASLFCRWTSASVLPEVYQLAFDDAERPRPDASTMFFMWSAVEDAILSAWLDKVQQRHPRHISLHFDGVRVDRDAVGPEATAFCSECSDRIKTVTGFDVTICVKAHLDFLEGIRVGSAKREQTTVNAELLVEGNCIPCALHALGYCQAVKKFLEDTTGESATYMRRRHHRTYGQVAAGTGVSLFAYSLDLPSVPLRAKYLTHLGARQKPHCVAMEVAEKDFLRVLEGKNIFTVSREAFWRAFSAACDQRHIVFFHVDRDPAACEPVPDIMPSLHERERLLDLQAGASGGEDHQCEAHTLDGDSEKAASDREVDEEAATDVADVLLQCLEQEVREVQKPKTITKADARNRVRCPMCPFRSWQKKNGHRVLDHIRQYHTARQQYAASGTKQLKLVIAMHDQDRLQGRPPAGDYLRRSADMMRSSIRTPLPEGVNNVDKKIRLVFTGRGPEYGNLSDTIEASLRRVRNLYYDMDFAQKLYQRTLMCNARPPVPCQQKHVFRRALSFACFQ